MVLGSRGAGGEAVAQRGLRSRAGQRCGPNQREEASGHAPRDGMAPSGRSSGGDQSREEKTWVHQGCKYPSVQPCLRSLPPGALYHLTLLTEGLPQLARVSAHERSGSAASDPRVTMASVSPCSHRLKFPFLLFPINSSDPIVFAPSSYAAMVQFSHITSCGASRPLSRRPKP